MSVFAGIASLAAGVFLLDAGREPGITPQEAVIVMRNVGHHVLQAAGDSTSRVLPVHDLGEHTYLIRFESPFTFEPDSLVEVIRRSIQQGPGRSIAQAAYTVNVLKCVGEEVVYGYQIAGRAENTLVPCRGRVQPRDCYMIRISFQQPSAFTFKAGLQVLSGFLAAAVLFVGFSYAQKARQRPKHGDAPVAIGKYNFSFGQRTLAKGSSAVELTAKEAKLLRLFANHPNEVLERDRLLKEVWEDEGVFVGRSLDMFVSKLRKKLQDDPSVKIQNVHGKGYKLCLD